MNLTKQQKLLLLMLLQTRGVEHIIQDLKGNQTDMAPDYDEVYDMRAAVIELLITDIYGTK